MKNELGRGIQSQFLEEFDKVSETDLELVHNSFVESIKDYLTEDVIYNYSTMKAL